MSFFIHTKFNVKAKKKDVNQLIGALKPPK